MRRSHFKVDGLRGFGTTGVGRVTIEQGGANAIITVRPLRSSNAATMLLSDVAQIILERDAKNRVDSARRKR